MMVCRTWLLMLATSFLVILNVARADDVVLQLPPDDPNENSDTVRAPDGTQSDSGILRT